MDENKEIKLLMEIIEEEEIKIKGKEELYAFIRNPELYTENKKVIKKVNDLKELLDLIGGR